MVGQLDCVDHLAFEQLLYSSTNTSSRTIRRVADSVAAEQSMINHSTHDYSFHSRSSFSMRRTRSS